MGKLTPELRTVLVLGTGHVSEATRDWLNREGEKAAGYFRHENQVFDVSLSPGVHMGAHVYGWTIYAHEPGEWVEPSTPEAIIECLDPIFAYAQQFGAYLIHFDADADTVDALPVHDW